METEIQTDLTDIYNYTARMHDLVLKIYRAKFSIRDFDVFETVNTRGVSINGVDEVIKCGDKKICHADVYGIRRYYELCHSMTELYDDFFEELAATHLEQKRVIDFINRYLVENIVMFMPENFLPPDDGKEFVAIIEELRHTAEKIGDTYPHPEKNIDEVYNLITKIRDEVLDIKFDKDDRERFDFNWLMRFGKDIDQYKLVGLNGCNRRVESSFLMVLSKLKLLSDKYDDFRNNHKIATIIVDLISLLTSFGIITGLVGLGQSIIKLIPNYEFLDKATIEEIVRLVDMS